MKTVRLAATLLMLVTVVVACTTTGVGGGWLAGSGSQEDPVTFNWKSTDGGMSGTMVAALADKSFQGQFFQITQQTQSESLSPLWTHWRSGWYDWPYWDRPFLGPHPYPFPATQFITYYSGKVVATLESGDKQRMRCRFHLASPSRGMSGGGEGECQLPDNRVIRAVFVGK